MINANILIISHEDIEFWVTQGYEPYGLPEWHCSAQRNDNGKRVQFKCQRMIYKADNSRGERDES